MESGAVCGGSRVLHFFTAWCLYARAARVGLVHIGVFILLLLSGERNFGVRLNKPYTLRVPMDIPVFTGTHADLLIVVGASQRQTFNLVFCNSLKRVAMKMLQLFHGGMNPQHFIDYPVPSLHISGCTF